MKSRNQHPLNEISDLEVCSEVGNKPLGGATFLRWEIVELKLDVTVPCNLPQLDVDGKFFNISFFHYILQVRKDRGLSAMDNEKFM